MAKHSNEPSKLHLNDKSNNTYSYFDDICLLNNPEFSKYSAKNYSKKISFKKSYIKVTTSFPKFRYFSFTTETQNK